MSPQAVRACRREPPGSGGMLFVRTVRITDAVVNIPLLIAGVLVAAAVVPLQSSLASPRAMDLVIYADGTTHISAEIEADPLSPAHELRLFGNSIDNFVAVGGDEFLLESEIAGGTATIETFGSPSVSVRYDTHDLVSKQGRIWTFSLDAPSDFTLLLPQNSVIVAMTNIPIDSEVADGQNLLTLAAGPTEIDYVFGSSGAQAVPPTSPPPGPQPGPQEPFPETALLAMAGAVVGAAVLAYLLKRQKKAPPVPVPPAAPEPAPPAEPKPAPAVPDPEEIFRLNPDMRDDDKEIVKFISDSGGEVFESDLRKRFLQPRTTMWRAVKRLERHGIVETQKKEMQNLVRLRRTGGKGA